MLKNDDLPGMEVVYVWATDTMPRVPNAGHEPTRVDQEFFPGPEGTRFVVITYPPGFGAAPASSVGADGDAMAETVSFDQIFMHATPTIDYGIVLEGELVLVLDSGEEVTLRASDVVVQNGTVHGWRNTSVSPAKVAYVIVGARPTNGQG